MDFDDKIYEQARKKGYLNGIDRNGFVCAYIRKWPNRTCTIDILKKILGRLPTWEDMTRETLEDYEDILTREHSANGVFTYNSMLRTVLKSNEDAVPCKNYRDILRNKRETSQSVFLNDDEIGRLLETDTDNMTEEYVKYTFLISCYTGCRHSDAVTITIDNISKNRLTYVSKKTKREAVMPVHRNLVRCIENRPSGVTIDDGTYNAVIRDLCRRAGIDDIVKVYKAGKTSSDEKWKFVSSHTARRSFCTNLYLGGIDVQEISQLAGHSDVFMTMRYIVAKRGFSDKLMELFS